MATPPGYVLVKSSELKPESKEVKQENSTTLTARGGRSAARGAFSKGLPPELNSTIQFRHVYRYSAQDASISLKEITVQNLMISFGAMATLTTQVSSLCSAIRLRKIVIYSAANATGSFVSPFVAFDSYSGSDNAKDELKTRPLPSGITTPDAIVYKVPKDSEAYWWQSGQAASSKKLFSIAAQVGSVIDVYADVCLQNVGTNIQESGFTSLTVGLVYYPALDGRSTNDFPPVGRTNAV